MKKVLILDLIGADAKLTTLFVGDIKVESSNPIKINNRTLDEVKNELGYSDHKIVNFEIRNGSVKKLNTLPTEEEKRKWFEDNCKQLHYLFEKPVDKWDEYDRSNWYSLNRKATV